MAISKRRGVKSSAQDNFLEPKPIVITSVTMVTGRPYGDGAVDLVYYVPEDSPPATLITWTSSPATTTQTTNNMTNYRFTGLSGGTSYTFTGVASNAAGNAAGTTTGTSTSIITVPQAPSAPTATAQVNQDSVSWSAPANNGGSAITGYTLKSSDGPTYDYGAGVTSATISETANSSQTYQVLAKNAQGNSAYSASSGSVTTLPPYFPFFPPFFPFFPPFFPFFPPFFPFFPFFPPFFPFFPPFFPFFPYFPPFFPYFPPFFPFFPYFPPFFPYFPPFFPFFPYFPPFFPYFPPYFPFFPYFPPFFPYFPPYFPFFPPYFKASQKCLNENTQVLTTDGYKAAKDISVGDKLYTIAPHDMSDGKVENAQIPAKVNFVEVEVVKAEASDKSEMIKFNDLEDLVTGTQPVFVKTANAEHAPNAIIATYKMASEVKVGDILIKVSPEPCEISEIEVKSIEIISGPHKVYDIRTSPWPWFITKGFTVIS